MPTNPLQEPGGMDVPRWMDAVWEAVTDHQAVTDRQASSVSPLPSGVKAKSFSRMVRRVRRLIVQYAKESANYVIARQAIRLEDAARRMTELEIRIHSTFRRAFGVLQPVPCGSEEQLNRVNEAINSLQSRVVVLETNLECSRTKESVAVRRADQAEAESARLRLQINGQLEKA